MGANDGPIIATTISVQKTRNAAGGNPIVPGMDHMSRDCHMSGIQASAARNTLPAQTIRGVAAGGKRLVCVMAAHTPLVSPTSALQRFAAPRTSTERVRTRVILCKLALSLPGQRVLDALSPRYHPPGKGPSLGRWSPDHPIARRTGETARVRRPILWMAGDSALALLQQLR